MSKPKRRRYVITFDDPRIPDWTRAKVYRFTMQTSARYAVGWAYQLAAQMGWTVLRVRCKSTGRYASCKRVQQHYRPQGAPMRSVLPT